MSGVKQESLTLWHATTTIVARDPLVGDLRADVAIVGAGITGLTAALLLLERGKSVIVVERETVGGGETGNTTAHITEAVDARYHWLRRNYDKETARLVAEASRASMEKIAEHVERFSIDCHFERVPGYLYTEKRGRVAEVKSEAAAASEAGLAARFVTDVPLPFLTRGAALFENQAQFHPQEYLLGIAARVEALGGRIYERSQVTEIDGSTVRTASGSVTAESIFMATNTPIDSYQTIHIKAAPYRTYAVAFAVSEEHPHGLFWDTAEPYHYTRWQKTDEGTFCIIGGEDHKVGMSDDAAGAFERLEQYCAETWKLTNPKYRWSGQVIEPADGLPFIGGSGNFYLSAGYAGQGMTFGTFGGMLVADLITGVENRWAKLFDPGRVHLRGATKDLISENKDFPIGLAADRLTDHDVEGTSLDAVRSGEAKILKIEGKKIAAFRDESGVLHACSAVCTHMRCDVGWNPAEKTWDCPCHGSRFTPDGEVLNGPAKENLAPFEGLRTAD